MSGIASEFNRFVQRSVCRDAVEVTKLERTKPKRSRDRRKQLCVRAGKQRLDERVERELPAKYAEYKCGGEVTVGLRKVAEARGVQKIVGMCVGERDAFEDLEGGGSRGGDSD
jgi:hypothetical protein